MNAESRSTELVASERSDDREELLEVWLTERRTSSAPPPYRESAPPAPPIPLAPPAPPVRDDDVAPWLR